MIGTRLRGIRFILWSTIGIATATLAALALSGKLLPPISFPLAASIGGPFELTSHTGRRVSDRDLRGKPFAIFFGFTQCPDVCPTTLLDISNHLAALGPSADRINVVFVTVDPERDTAEHLAAYLKSFDSRIIGLAGTATETAGIVRTYRVLVQKVPTSSGYTINHTATVFLMNGEGRFVGSLSFQEPPETQIAKLRRLVDGQ